MIYLTLFHHLLVQFLLSLSKADLPPHCLHGDVLGVWRIHEGTWHSCENDANYTDRHCGYPYPDNPELHESLGVIPPDVSPKFKGNDSYLVRFTSTGVQKISAPLRLASRHRNQIDAAEPETSREDYHQQDGPRRRTASRRQLSSSMESMPEVEARWTMVYDEGLHWTAADGKNFFAYFKYLPSPDDPEKIRSYCGTTMVGWSTRESPPARACWWGQKIINQDGSKVDPEQWTNEIMKHRPSLVEVSKEEPNAKTDVTALLAHIANGNKEEEVGFHWRPVDTPFIEIGDQKITYIEDLNNLVGQLRRFHQDVPDLPRFATPSTWEASGYPGEHMDWTNPDDVFSRIGHRRSMVPLPASQGKCGSCYGIVAANMLTSRLWIREADNPEVSGRVYVSEIPAVECTPYSQGCAGGFIFLALKYAAENGLPTKECLDSLQLGWSPNKDLCRALGRTDEAPETCGGAPRPLITGACRLEVHVPQWGYVGGAFGMANEQKIKEALFNRGPVAVLIEPTPELVTYRSGIFHTPLRLASEYRENDKRFPWQKADHAVLIVGYGEERDAFTGQRIPYWKVMNSWGPKWGEDGFFRILRGRDELGSETKAVEAVPRLALLTP